MFRCRRGFFLLLIVLFSTGLTLIFLTWNKSSDPFFIRPISKTNISQTSFQPSAFLDQLSPKNLSYCDFPYGTLDDWSVREEDVAFTPELGDKSPYRVLYNVLSPAGTNWSETITYASHTTVDLIPLIAELAQRWLGPLSIAIFVPGLDIMIALEQLGILCDCLPAMQNVSVHFVYPVLFPPNISLSEHSSSNCSLKRVSRMESFRTANNLTYPVNVARNVARAGSKTKYLLVSDIELFPSYRIIPEFFSMLQRLGKKAKSAGEHFFLKKRHVFVVPVFEVAANVTFLPSTKPELLKLFHEEQAVYFHKHICQHCQRFPGLQQWLQRKYPPHSNPFAIEPMLIVKREFPNHRWEPIYIGTNRQPWYSELLSWEGKQDKMTQMYEMCLMDYRFVILDGAFLVHSPGIRKKSEKNSLGRKTLNKPQSIHVQRNTYLYNIITHDTAGKYGGNQQCRPT